MALSASAMIEMAATLGRGGLTGANKREGKRFIEREADKDGKVL